MCCSVLKKWRNFKLEFLHQTFFKFSQHSDNSGSAKANWREPKSCLGQVFNCKLGYFVMYAIAQHIQACPSRELKTQLRFHPFSWSLSMDNTIGWTWTIDLRMMRWLFCHNATTTGVPIATLKTKINLFSVKKLC
jgi:hypothetical protein